MLVIGKWFKNLFAPFAKIRLINPPTLAKAKENYNSPNKQFNMKPSQENTSNCDTTIESYEPNIIKRTIDPILIKCYAALQKRSVSQPILQAEPNFFKYCIQLAKGCVCLPFWSLGLLSSWISRFILKSKDAAGSFNRKRSLAPYKNGGRIGSIWKPKAFILKPPPSLFQND